MFLGGFPSRYQLGAGSGSSAPPGRAGDGVGAGAGRLGSSRGDPHSLPPSSPPRTPCQGKSLAPGPCGSARTLRRRRWNLCGCQGGVRAGRTSSSPVSGNVETSLGSILRRLCLEPLPGLWPRSVDRFGEWPPAGGGRGRRWYKGRNGLRVLT